MAKKGIKETTLKKLADAIREKLGITDLIPVTDYATKISEMPAVFTPDLAAFSLIKPEIDAAFTGFSTDTEKSLWYSLFNNMSSTCDGIIKHLTTDFTLEFPNDLTYSEETLTGLIKAVDTGKTLTLQGLELESAYWWLVYSFAESTIEGNIEFNNVIPGGRNITLSKDVPAWCNKLSFKNIEYSTSDNVKFILKGCGINELEIGDFTYNGEGLLVNFDINQSEQYNIKKLTLSGKKTIYNLDYMFTSSRARSLTEVDIDFSTLNIYSMNSTFSYLQERTGIPKNMVINSPYLIDMENAFNYNKFIETVTIGPQIPVYDCYQMFAGCETIKNVVFQGTTTKEQFIYPYFEQCFYGAKNLESVTLSLESGGGCKTMSGMFEGCISLKEIVIKVPIQRNKSIVNFAAGCTALENFSPQLLDVNFENYAPPSWEGIITVWGNLKIFNVSTLSFISLTAFSTVKGCFSNGKLFNGENATCVVTWPAEIKFSALTADETFSFVGCATGTGSDFVKNFVSSNKTVTVTISAADYALLTADEISNFTSNGGVLNQE